jgi:hypothetical protein
LPQSHPANSAKASRIASPVIFNNLQLIWSRQKKPRASLNDSARSRPARAPGGSGAGRDVFGKIR